MDAMHGLGYTMIVAVSTPDVLNLYREYHENVLAILWQDTDNHSRPCVKSSTCVYTNAASNEPPPPPNSTHVNIPIWYATTHMTLVPHTDLIESLPKQQIA